ncbi:ADP-ribosylglycohydrolase family protein [Sulfurimonas sp. HSL-1716]|uniref:ADP-ribosylglycohydrolase family protein n=1 Tax=Hydrocurvibacter sulfurireducens TaxID=3131937 RepID=UPI0031F7E931
MRDVLRIKNALWGLFISDAVCMPAHWYYNLDYLKKDFGKITGYNDAPHPHLESFMVGNPYFPDVKNAKELGRSYDILHEHIRFYDTSYSHLQTDVMAHSGEHGNLMPRFDERYHYHHGLKAGENTLGANLIRVLMRSVIKNGGYDEKSFLDDFVQYMTSGTNRDPYLEIYLRDWFENYSKGIPPELCAGSQKDKWSIAAHGGIIRPLVLSLLSKNSYEGLGVAITHQELTHRSQNISSALGVLIPFLTKLLHGEEPMKQLNEYAKQIPLIKIHGDELTRMYHDHKGPSNIPKELMWKIHTEFSDEYLDEILPSATDESMITKRFATACYPEHGVPLIFYFLYKNGFDFKSSLFDNANAGGDNVHRGIILGLLSGASAKEIPESLKESLIEYRTLKDEINAFAEYCK